MRTLARRQRGLTLIELMISLTIGLTVATAGLSLYLGATKTRTAVHERIRLQESAYFIRQTLVRYLSEAGHRPLDASATSDLLLPIRTHGDAFPAVTDRWATGQYVRASSSGVLEIRALGSSAADGSADGSITDCLGNPIPAHTRVTMSFATDGETFSCTVDGTAVAVAGGGEDVLVEDIVWKLGVDDDNDGQVDRLVDASESLTASVPRSLTAHVLLTTASRVLDADADYVFDGATLTSTDRRLRTESIVVVELRN